MASVLVSLVSVVAVSPFVSVVSLDYPPQAASRVTHIVAASRIASNFFMVYSAPFHFKFF